jgi:DNA-binding response OmpR family regulator
MRVLVIEDNHDLAANLCEYLEERGHQVDAAGDGLTGLHLAVHNTYDTIVLDVILPGMNGITVCRKLREEADKDTPVLMLTARDSVEDRVTGLEAGADDYLIKPFALREVDARLLALVRRSYGAGKGRLRRLEVADLRFDTGTLMIRRGARAVELPPTPMRILEMLMKHSPRVVSRRDIETLIWGDTPPDSDALRAHMHVLRSAIDHAGEPPLLQTVRGHGYRLADADTL